MTTSIDSLRRRAKKLHKAYEAGHTTALQRVASHNPRATGDLLHADFLYVVAREEGFESWPKLKIAAQTQGLDFAKKLQRLKIALYKGQNAVVQRLLTDTPDLAEGHFDLQVALLNKPIVAQMLASQPALATTQFGPRRPILHLAFSRHIHSHPELADDMLGIATMLVDHGASVDDNFSASGDGGEPLSALYGAIAHADNISLARWLLEQGANPDDGESLYHSTELRHHDALKMLLEFGAKPEGTNALLRALDFDDAKAVEMLLGAGANVNEARDLQTSGDRANTIPVLHQAARRMSHIEICTLLLEHGADPTTRFEGTSAYGYARVFGNRALADAIEASGASGADLTLSKEEQLLASAADDTIAAGNLINPAQLPDAYRNIVRFILHLPGKLPHVKRLVALGAEYDLPDSAGMTAVQIAGWEGLPEMMAYLLSLKPDLSHTNNFGGTLLSTIVHGSENCPERSSRDYIACAELALNEGVALPLSVINSAGNEKLHAYLSQWGEAHPGQLVQG